MAVPGSRFNQNKTQTNRPIVLQRPHQLVLRVGRTTVVGSCIFMTASVALVDMVGPHYVRRTALLARRLLGQLAKNRHNAH
jgi:hypothetical protein